MKRNKLDILFYLLFICSVVFILLSYPFVQQPFDMWVHLSIIESIIHYNNVPEYLLHDVFVVPVWHYAWAYFFRLISVDNVFTISLVIHRIQFLLTFVLVFFASKNLSKAIGIKHNLFLNYLSLLSFIIFCLQTGTYSVYIQQSWIMWYSITYQIVLPIYFLILSMIFLNFNQCLSQGKFYFVILLSALVAVLHGLESLYLVTALIVIMLLHLMSMKFNLRKLNWKMLSQYLLLIMVCLVCTKLISTSKNFHSFTLANLWQNGNYLVYGANRVDHSYSSLMYLSLCANFILIFCSPKRFIIFTLFIINVIFLLIPTLLPLAALYSILGTPIVWRFFFGTISFFAIPALLYYSYQKNHWKIILITMFAVLFCCFSYNVKQNFMSIADQQTLEAQMMHNIKNNDLLLSYIKTNKLARKNIIYARADIANLLNCNGYQAYTFIKSNPNETVVSQYAVGNKRSMLIISSDIFTQDKISESYFQLNLSLDGKQ